MATGTAPGVITPDGCAVDLYTLLPPMGEPGVVHAAVPAGASVLELGAGAGRVTHPLVALGHPVVAVDESPEMLARVRGAETVLARIQDLRLGRRFDAVLLASQLVNTPTSGSGAGSSRPAASMCATAAACSSSATRRAGSRRPPRVSAPPAASPSGYATCAGPAPACSPPPSSTGWATGAGPSRSPPSASTTKPWRPPWPRPGWPSTPT